MVQNNVVLMDIVVVQSVVRRFLAIRKRRQLKHAVMRIQRHLSSLQTQVIARRHRKQMVASILCQVRVCILECFERGEILTV